MPVGCACIVPVLPVKAFRRKYLSYANASICTSSNFTPTIIMTSNNLIENPVVFFLYDKVDVMNHDDIGSLASIFYTKEEIRDANQTL